MTHEEVKILLNDYFDEKLSIEVNTEIQVHLSECADCSQYLFSLQDLMKKADRLPRNIKPTKDLWNDIFVALSDIKAESIKQKEELDIIEAKQLSEESEEERKKREVRVKAEKLLEWERKKAVLRKKIKKSSFVYSLIGLISILILFLIYNIFFSHAESWDVKKLRAGSSNYSEAFAKLAEDEMLETNSITRLQVKIPKVGTSFLEVIDGWAAVNKDNLGSLVLPNHFCIIKADSGVGLPYRNGSSKEFVDAINDYCFTNPANEESLISILTKADVSNSVTLWNLMKRVTRKQRDMVVYTIFGLLGDPPAGVTDDGLKTLDSEMLKKLIEEIEVKI